MNREAKPVPGQAGALMAVAVGAVISLPALVLGILLVPLARWRRLEMLLFALLGLGVTVLLYPRITAQVESALRAPTRPGGLSEDPGRALEAAWPHVRAWWIAALGLAPTIACGVELFRPRSSGGITRAR